MAVDAVPEPAGSTHSNPYRLQHCADCSHPVDGPIDSRPSTIPAQPCASARGRCRSQAARHKTAGMKQGRRLDMAATAAQLARHPASTARAYTTARVHTRVHAQQSLPRTCSRASVSMRCSSSCAARSFSANSLAVGSWGTTLTTCTQTSTRHKHSCMCTLPAKCCMRRSVLHQLVCAVKPSPACRLSTSRHSLTSTPAPT